MDFKLNFCLLVVLLSIFLGVREGRVLYYHCIIDGETQKNRLSCPLIMGPLFIQKHLYPGSHLMPLLVHKARYNHVSKLPEVTSLLFLFSYLIRAHPSKFNSHPTSRMHHFKHEFGSSHSH